MLERTPQPPTPAPTPAAIRLRSGYAAIAAVTMMVSAMLATPAIAQFDAFGPKNGGSSAAPAEPDRPQAEPERQRPPRATSTRERDAEANRDRDARPRRTIDDRREKLRGFLLAEYAKLGDTKDFIARSLAAISIARLPGRVPTDRLLEMMEADNHDLVRLTAWQAFLSRPDEQHLEHFDRWLKLTHDMDRAGLFRGNLRIGLFNMLAVTPPGKETRDIFSRHFANTNSQDSHEVPVLEAMGKALGQWQDVKMAEGLVGAMGDLNSAYRAEYILGHAGSNVPPAIRLVDKGSEVMWQETRALYADWLNEIRTTWKSPTEVDLTAWRNLRPQHVPSPPDFGSIDPDDPKWVNDLELGMLRLRSFDVGFALDTTGSMEDVIKWMARDVRTMLKAFATLSREPRIGITYYRDENEAFVTRNMPLTDDGNALAQSLRGMDADGGGDIPEAVYDGLFELIMNNRWSRVRSDNRRVVILLGDAPPHEEDMDQLRALLGEAKGMGFKIFAIKVATKYGSADMSAFDEIAELGNGVAMDLSLGSAGNVQREGRNTSRHEKAKVAEPHVSGSNDPCVRVVTEVLVNVLNPQFRDRVEPFVRVVLAYNEESLPERRVPFPPKVEAPPPPVMPGGGGGPPPPREPRKPKPPYDPQK